ncbi:MAG TPA: DUF2505 family protein [Polyangiaceae bacterium]|nr:DUF2505 family protein [Polyangiaceae bacterium]
MADLRIEHVFETTDDGFWKLFFDPEYNRKLFLETLGFESWKIASFDESDSRIERVVDVVPKVGELPGPLKKLAEGGAGYRERDSFDKAQKRMKVTIEPSALQGKLTIGGTMYTKPEGDRRVRRIYDTSVVAKVFGVGGMIENRILSEVKTSYDQAAVFTNRWIKEKGL